MSFVNNPEKFFVIADYLFITSYHEGLNYSVLEALITKTLVISNKILGVSEIIKNQINGFLIKKNSHKLFFDIVIKCEHNSSKKIKMQNNGLKTVAKYDRELFLKHYEAFISKL